MANETQEKTFTENLSRGERELLPDAASKRASVVERSTTDLVAQLLGQANRQAMSTLKELNIPTADSQNLVIPAKAGNQSIKESSYNEFPVELKNDAAEGFENQAPEVDAPEPVTSDDASTALAEAPPASPPPPVDVLEGIASRLRAEEVAMEQPVQAATQRQDANVPPPEASGVAAIQPAVQGVVVTPPLVYGKSLAEIRAEVAREAQ